MKIAYFTSEFPGQTHIFLWREYQALLRLGVDARLVSTRMPRAGSQSNGWGQQAAKKTHYLFPLSLFDIWMAAVSLVRCSSACRKQIWDVFFKTEGLAFKAKLSLFAHLILATQMSRYVKSQGFSHIHCTTCASTANIAMFCHFLTGIQYSLSLLGPKLETYGPNQANKWRFASFGLFQSQKLLKETHSAIPGCVPRRHAFAPVGVNTQVVRRTGPYVAWKPGETLRLYSCGRLHPIKGHEYVIQATKLLVNRGYAVELFIGGEDIQGGHGHRKHIEAEIDRNQMQSIVRLLGAVSEEENILQYQSAHVYVMGSLDEAAGAVAAMEAMSMEVPVVMPNVGATSELIAHEKEGLLVEAKNPTALADAIERLLIHPELAFQLGQAGRKKVHEQFNDHISAQVIADFLAASHSNAR